MTARAHGGEAGFTLVRAAHRDRRSSSSSRSPPWACSTSSTATTARLVDQNAAADKARATVDRIARDLRNHATPTTALPDAIERAAPTDVALLTVGANQPAGSANLRNIRRVRYCVNTAERQLWMQTQAWTTASPPSPRARCRRRRPARRRWEPSNTHAWTDRVLLTDHIVNPTAFTFTPTHLRDDGGDPRRGHRLHVDADPAVAPAATQLATKVALRNQNRPPVAGFALRVLGNRHVQLISTNSSDPEGHELEYRWFSGTTDLTAGSSPSARRRRSATSRRPPARTSSAWWSPTRRTCPRPSPPQTANVL
jgi:hypothetical protein